MSTKQPWTECWEVKEDLSRGGQGTTKVVRRSSDERAGILKILNNQKSTQARIRMYQEVAHLKVLHSLKCRVPEVLDGNTNEYEDPDVLLFFVMERIEGETLTELVRKEGGLSVEESVGITTMICETIQKAIAEGIYHRDLKPDNIMVKPSDDRRIVVIDYGLSFNSREPISITQTGEQLDNEFLSLPERRAPGGNRRDPRSDITSALGILYYCISGKKPVELSDANGQPPHRRPGFAISEKIEGHALLPMMEAVFDRGFSVILEDRFQTVEELLRRMRSLQHPETETPRADPIASAAESSKRLLRLDRKTQIETFRSNCKTINEVIGREINQLGQGLATSGFRLAHGNMASEYERPSAGDEVLTILITVSFQHNSSMTGIAYVVTANRRECVLYRQLLKGMNSRGRGGQPAEDWTEVLHFEGLRQPNTAVVVADFKQALDEGIRLLEQDILKGAGSDA
ncbi:MAG: phosphotransferase [Planctomycetota bacterium]|nr:phosphotransferase [Planctomycetota bacterium]